MNIFEKTGLKDPILKALNEKGYTEPTPIQSRAVPILINGNDLLGCAQTGTGKTAAFALPVLHRLSEEKKSGIRCLVLAPTRELALQVHESFVAYGKYLKIRSVVVFGGVSQLPQEQELKKGCDILVATPGRLIDLVDQGIIKLKQLEILILDEADRMLDMGFIRDIRKIMQWIPSKRQTMLFSATMPEEIKKLASGILKNPEYVEVAPVSSTAERVRQWICHTDKKLKRDLLLYLISEESMPNVLVFTRTKHGADKIVRYLNQKKVNSMAIHGNKSQQARQQALNRFKSGELKVLVATDIAARGIDIAELPYVINFDLPNEPETYVHRIGRTGRAGAEGTAYSFCSEDEKPYLKDIQKLIKKNIPVIDSHPFPPGTFVQDSEEKPVQRNNRNNHSQKNTTGSSSNQNKFTGHPNETFRKKRRNNNKRKKKSGGLMIG
jgi:ATP-dependent RNA helicase RhlE